MEATVTNNKNAGLFGAIAVTGLLAGTLDILAACTQFAIKTGKSPVIVLQYVASGLLGKTAYSDATMMPALGLLFHYIIAFGWTVLFFILYPRISFLRGNRVAVVAGYGLFVWLMMNRVVVPLSLVQQGPFSITGAIQAALILIVCISLPVTTLARRYYSKQGI